MSHWNGSGFRRLPRGWRVFKARPLMWCFWILRSATGPGWSTFSQLHAQVPDVPIIVLSGLASEVLAIKTVHEGAQDYLVKGQVDSRELVRSIRYAIGRAKVERELGSERQRLRALLQTTPDHISFKDEKGRFVQINQALADFLGLENPEAAIGKTDFNFFNPENAQTTLREEEKIMLTGEGLRAQVERESLSDGRTAWVLSSKMPLKSKQGRIVGTFGIARDITEAKLAEEALRASEERYRVLLGSVTDYIYTVYFTDGHQSHTRHGEGCLAVTGYSPEDYASIPDLWLTMVHEEDRTAVVDHLSTMLLGGHAQGLEHRIVHKDGSTRWVRLTLVPRKDGFGNVISYDGMIADITERKRARQNLEEANARLQQVLADLMRSHEELKRTQTLLARAERMQSIGRLASGIAHEIKNPLATLEMGVDWLGEQEWSGEGKAPVVLREMNEAIERANHVIGALAASSSSTPLNAGSICDIVERALSLVAGEASQRGIIVENALAKDLPECRIDPDDITRVFLSVFLNAFQAMPTGGKLRVTGSVETVKVGDMAFVEGDRSGAGVRVCGQVVQVSVEDSGAGIPPDKIDLIFDPFFTTKPAGKGMGLGLTVSQKIMERHGGRILVSNRPTGGATVVLTFPAMERTSFVNSFGEKGGRRDSNPQQPEPQSGALPLSYDHRMEG